jgi:hypothetical protein
MKTKTKSIDSLSDLTPSVMNEWVSKDIEYWKKIMDKRNYENEQLLITYIKKNARKGKIEFPYEDKFASLYWRNGERLTVEQINTLRKNGFTVKSSLFDKFHIIEWKV